MKIFSPSSDQMVLKDGNAMGLVWGIVLTVGGGFAAYRLYATGGIANGAWVAAIVSIVGLAILLTAPSISVTIDKTQQQILSQKKRLVGNKIKTYNIVDVLRVELREAFTSANTTTGTSTLRRQTLSYQSVIVFKNGDEVPLENMKNAGNGSIGGAVLMGGTGRELSMANQVANFLGVPFQEIAPGSPAAVFGAPTGFQ